jgi:hypothetical protein
MSFIIRTLNYLVQVDNWTALTFNSPVDVYL